MSSLTKKPSPKEFKESLLKNSDLKIDKLSIPKTKIKLSVSNQLSGSCDCKNDDQKCKPIVPGTWTTITAPFPVQDGPFGPFPGGAQMPLLLTDGSILVLNIGIYTNPGEVWRLFPDNKGSYVTGTWLQMASFPAGYAPLYCSSAILPDGTVYLAGGEYNGPNYDFALTNMGALYDPVLNTWYPFTGPSFFQNSYPPRVALSPHPIGDASCMVMADSKRLLQSDKMSRQCAFLDLEKVHKNKEFNWKEVGTSTKADLNDEETWVKLPDETVLVTTDCYTDFFFGLIPAYPTDPTNSEIFDPCTEKWHSGGSTKVTLTDLDQNETGPAILRPDGTVFATGSQSFTSIYDTCKKKWTPGPQLPIIAEGQLVAADSPAVLLRNGNVLFATSPSIFIAPTKILEYNGCTIGFQTTIPDSPVFGPLPSFAYNWLLLPTGQVFSVHQEGNDINIYTPGDQSFNKEWRPIIKCVPDKVEPGGTYHLSGIRLNGMSEAVSYGDDYQAATNYPLVQIKNLATGNIYYARTYNFSFMGVQSDKEVSCKFQVNILQDFGDSELRVITNGIQSKKVKIKVIKKNKC